MRLTRLLLLPVTALLVTACGVDDGPTVHARPQLAGVRFIHAMPDEGPVDARMVDGVRWTSSALGINFRQSGPVWPVAAGTHKVRVFRASSTDIDSIAILVEQDVTIEPNRNVTLLLTGSTAANSARIEIIPDEVPDSTAGNIHVRAVNVTGAPMEVAWVGTGGAATAPTAVGPLSATSYAARGADTVTARFNASGSATMITERAPAGAPENNGIGASAGFRTSGSALSAYIFPASVAGSRAPSDFTSPGVVWFVDRVPAPPRN